MKSAFSYGHNINIITVRIYDVTVFELKYMLFVIKILYHIQMYRYMYSVKKNLYPTPNKHLLSNVPSLEKQEGNWFSQAGTML